MGYEQFTKYLDDIGEDSFSISFGEIEKIIGEKLPESAFQYQAWWSNSDSHPFMREVLSHNWKSRKLNLERKNIEFYKTSESSLLKFLKDEMVMQANYQPIVIKMLLEAKDRGFTVSVKEIREKFDELNFGADTTSSINSVKGTLDETRGLVSFTGAADTDTATLKLDTFSSRDIPECLKICGQEIARWHLKEIVEDGFKLWRVKPGTEEEGWMYLDEFLETNSLGVGWNGLGDLSGFESEDDVNDHIDKVEPVFNSKSSVTAISHKMSEKDLVVVTKAQKELVDYGIIVSKYEFEDKGKGSYAHRRRVVWLSQGPVLKSDFPDEHFGGSLQAAHEVHDPAKKIFIDFLLGEESESCDYWAILAEKEREGKSVTASWQLLLSSKKILYGDLNINLSDFYDEVGNYKHELPKGKKVSKELRDEIKKKDPNASTEKISWHAISFKLFAQVKKNDVVVVWSGNKKDGYKIHGHGKVVSEYEWTRGTRHDSFYHQKQVEWLDTVERELPHDVGEKEAKKLFSVDKLPDEWKKLLFGKKQQNYFILTQNPDSKSSNAYEDISGVQYAYDNRKAHYTKFVEGTNFIVQSKIEGQYYFVGYGKVGKIEKSEETDDKGKPITKIIAKFSKYTEFEEQKIRTEEINKKMLQLAFPNKGSNPQPPAMLPITRSLYAEIIGEDLIDDDQLPDTLDLDKFVRALNWKPNLILYGPPGTGKTWQAKRIAKLITKNQNNSSDSEYSLSRYGKKLYDILDIKKHTWKMIATKILLENNGTAINYHDMSKLATEYRDTSGLTPHETIAKDIRDDIEKFGDDSFFTHPSDGMYGLKTPTTFAKAAEMILFAENKPMHFNEINKIALDKHIVSTEGVTPEKSLLAEITKSIQADGDKSKFLRVDDGIYVLRSLVKNINLKNFSSYIKRVTFHQSFSYEEFIEGIKVNPTENGTGVTYDVEPGIFQVFCIHAQKDDKNNYVMIIDEINRGNIAKIFGELITIIENDKRGEPVTLAYSKKEFNVPENVFIIGTMNTADQSLTHLDAALKRRFTMIEIPPDSNVLEHSKVEGVDLTNLLDAINKKLVEHKFRDRRIGHSYFMSKDENSGQTGSITKIEDLQMAFATDIIPVLRDHFYDQEDILKDILGNEFLDWENDQDLKEDWQEDKEIFKEILKKAFGV